MPLCVSLCVCVNARARVREMREIESERVCMLECVCVHVCAYFCEGCCVRVGVGVRVHPCTCVPECMRRVRARVLGCERMCARVCLGVCGYQCVHRLCVCLLASVNARVCVRAPACVSARTHDDTSSGHSRKRPTTRSLSSSPTSGWHPAS